MVQRSILLRKRRDGLRLQDVFADLDYFFYILGANIKRCYYKSKEPIGNWRYLQKNPLSKEEYEKLKQVNALSNWGLFTGKLWSRR